MHHPKIKRAAKTITEHTLTHRHTHTQTNRQKHAFNTLLLLLRTIKTEKHKANENNDNTLLADIVAEVSFKYSGIAVKKNSFNLIC